MLVICVRAEQFRPYDVAKNNGEAEEMISVHVNGIKSFID